MGRARDQPDMRPISPTHPIRCFQIDPMFGRKLEVMRAKRAGGRVNPATGLRDVAFDYGVPDDVCPMTLSGGQIWDILAS